MKRISVFWFRRDLRLDDNAGLYHALKGPYPVLPLFIFDRNILDTLEDPKDKRMSFLFQSLQELNEKLVNLGSSLVVKHATPLQAWKELVEEFDIASVFTNHDYEPYARKRDGEVKAFLNTNNIAFHSFKDQVILEKEEVIKESSEPYTVFTPYSKKWKAICTPFFLSSYPSHKYESQFLRQEKREIISLASLGFQPINFPFPMKTFAEEVLDEYENKRDFPAQNGTTHLGLHLRFGTISIRELARYASTRSETFLNELIWRDFYQMILWHFPQVETQAFKPAYDNIRWRNNEKEFAAWCEGKTGYPMVDAGMRELNKTGFMHNRVRMITASFLTKHLLIDWRWGEAYFAQKLLDYDLAANNGGWQWAAGCGTDAAPYFRIFNPALQTQKFDPQLEYVKKWVPEFQEFDYPRPIVDHEFARKRCLSVYKAALNEPTT
jgi:deoxyribodipyrimidine photo-lyase